MISMAGIKAMMKHMPERVKSETFPIITNQRGSVNEPSLAAQDASVDRSRQLQSFESLPLVRNSVPAPALDKLSIIAVLCVPSKPSGQLQT